MSVRGATAAAALSVAIVVMAACGGSGDDAVALQVTCAEFEAAGATVVERAIDVTMGAEFAVTLCANASTGFSWEDPTSDGDAGIELLGRSSAQPAGAPPGTPGQETFTFRATGAGSETIRFAYSQPWAGGMKDAWLTDVVVTVR